MSDSDQETREQRAIAQAKAACSYLDFEHIATRAGEGAGVGIAGGTALGMLIPYTPIKAAGVALGALTGLAGGAAFGGYEMVFEGKGRKADANCFADHLLHPEHYTPHPLPTPSAPDFPDGVPPRRY